MTDLVCYLGRAASGDSLASLRLVGERTDDLWTAPSPDSGEAGAISAAVRDGARWVAARLRSRPGSRVSVLCLDAEGARCSWVSAPARTPRVLAAAVASAPGLSAGGDSAVEPGDGATLFESSLEALGEDPPRPGGQPGAADRGAVPRLALLAAPDAVARLLIDALDDAGVAPAGTTSIWHAIASAWDPSSPVATEGSEGGPRGHRVVADEVPVTAILITDPAGRLLWAWSRRGRLLCAGSMRPAAGPDGSGLRADSGRLAADWLAWSAQLNMCPARVVAITAGDRPAMARIASGAWPAATIDTIAADDPVAETMRRLARAGRAGAPAVALTALTDRPGRAHRSMHRWIAAALLLAAVGLTALGVRVWTAASALRAAAADSAGEASRAAAEYNPRYASEPFLELALDDEIQSRSAPTSLRARNPVLEELENLAVCVGSFAGEGVSLEQVHVRQAAAEVDVRVPDTATADALVALVRSQCPSFTWSDSFPPGGRDPAGRSLVRISGLWKTERGP